MKTPSEYFNLPVIGVAKTKVLNYETTFQDGTKEPGSFESQEIEVIDIAMMGEKKVYVTNQWHKEYKKEPLHLMEYLVEVFTPK